MLRRFESIDRCGIFEEYRWDSSLPDLAKISVIFGSNGTGKTSLAGALDGLRNPPEDEGFRKLSLGMEDNLGERVSGGNDDPFFDRVHVFCEQYVARSHNFSPASSEMSAVLTVGEKPVGAEKRLGVLRELVVTKLKDRDKALAAELSANQAINTAYGQVSQQVVDAASRAGGRYRSRSNFSAGAVRSAFNGSHAAWAALTEIELREKVGLVNADKAEPLIESKLVVAMAAQLSDRLTNALETTPATIILDTLANNPDATSWVNDGRHFHARLDICIFCSSPLTEERKEAIDKHFSEAVEQLQDMLHDLKTELAQIEADAKTGLANIPSKGLFFEDLRPQYKVAAEQARTELAALEDWAAEVRRRVEAKATNVLAVVRSDVSHPPTVTAAKLSRLRREHNDRASKLDSLVQAAARAIELHYLKQAEPDVARNARSAAVARATATALDGELSDHDDEIISLESVDGDPVPSAKVLTEEVARLLGRAELRFEAVENRYVVTRDGEPAIGLSAGERTAIALVHFLESVARFSSSRGKPIVVIDDPVSSLDSDIFMGVSTYIWGECGAKGHTDQIILLTHNFELFRQWDIQVEALHRGGGMKTKYPASFYEIHSHYVRGPAGLLRRRPKLVAWPPSASARKKVRSSYHHAFITIAEARQKLLAANTLEHQLDAQLLFPNVVRRMLETFLAFKRPELIGDFTGAMRQSARLLREAGFEGDADALRLRLTRYAHAYSHSETPATDLTVSPDEVGTAIGAAFEFMYNVDRTHFEGLCSVVGVDPALLLPPRPATPELPDEAVA